MNLVRAQFSSVRGEETVDLYRIVLCKFTRTYCVVHLADGKKIRSQNTLKYFESIFPDALFQRVNKTTIVNLHHVAKFQKGRNANLILSNQAKVQVSVRKRKAVIKIIKSLFITLEFGKIYSDLKEETLLD